MPNQKHRIQKLGTPDLTGQVFGTYHTLCGETFEVRLNPEPVPFLVTWEDQEVDCPHCKKHLALKELARRYRGRR